MKSLTRKGLDWATGFRTSHRGRRASRQERIVDGEVVSEGSDGISSFSLLQQDLKSGRPDRMVFYVLTLSISIARTWDPAAGARKIR